MTDEKKNNSQEEAPSNAEESNENSQSYKRFSHGFGGVLLITLSSFSPNAHAGSFTVGPCGVHYT